MQPQPATPTQKDADVMDINGSREGDSKIPGFDLQIRQDPTFSAITRKENDVAATGGRELFYFQAVRKLH